MFNDPLSEFVSCPVESVSVAMIDRHKLLVSVLNLSGLDFIRTESFMGQCVSRCKIL